MSADGEIGAEKGSRRRQFLLFVMARAGWTVLAGWLIVSLTFVLIFLIPDYSWTLVLWGAALGGMSAEELIELEQELQTEQSLMGEYMDWMVTVITLDFGPVTGEIADALVVTLIYLIPAALLGFIGAMALGYISAIKRNSMSDYLLRSSTYLVLAVPNFLAAALVVLWMEENQYWLLDHAIPTTYMMTGDVSTLEVLEVDHLLFLILPCLFMATHLMAVQLRYARAESLEYLHATFVKTVRSKGASPRRVARHVLRTAAAPLFTLFVVEVIGILLVTIFVIEAVFNIPGIGLYAYRAVTNEMIIEILLVTLLFSIFILIADFLQDLSYAVLDPRTTAD